MTGIRVDFTPAGNPVSHGGSGSAYANFGCRCDECTAAHTARIGRRRAERASEEPPANSHGKVDTYNNWGCRCDPCSDAKSEANRLYREEHGE